jgi:hypothetical protein
MPGLSELGGTRPSRCREVSAALPAVLDGEAIDSRLAGHLEGCLACQAELAHYRKLGRTLKGLHDVVTDPGPAFLMEVLAGLTGPGGQEPGGALGWRRTACLGGVAVATAAGAIVWASRRRVSLAG